MGSKLGVAKIAAARLGISFFDYCMIRAAGFKHCMECREWRPESRFSIDALRGDDRKATCMYCESTSKGPIRYERERRRIVGEGWCRKCKEWFTDKSAARYGICQKCVNRDRRERYAADPEFKSHLQSIVYQRKRNVDSVPAHAAAFYLELFEGRCAYCDKAQATTWDHITAVSRGGKTTPGNIVPACHSCNSSKGNKDVHEWIAEKGIDPSFTLLDRLAFQYMGLYG